MMHHVPRTRLTAPAVAGRGLNEGLGRTGERSDGATSAEGLGLVFSLVPERGEDGGLAKAIDAFRAQRGSMN
jgi:hypothetical protein